MANPVAFYAVVHGRVQGVNFRYFVIQKAREMGIRGYVANLKDGISVEVYAEGERDVLNRLLHLLQLLHLLHSGPSRAEVDLVSVDWQEAKGLPNHFEVMY
jgi:acylphosphatase